MATALLGPGLTMRPITPDELRTFTWTTETAFSYRSPEDEVERFATVIEYDRTLAVFDGSEMVATAAAFSFELTLPGLARVPVAGVTAVGVVPTHRRRGLLRELMRAQLRDVRRRGEAMAVLTASESVIYGRFGYGLATSRVALEIARGQAALLVDSRPSGRLRLAPAGGELDVLEPLYDRVRRQQPGALARSRAYWARWLHVPQGEGFGPLFTVVYEAPGGAVDGAVTYRVKGEHAHGISHNHLIARDFLATSPEAYAALWEFVRGVDLIDTISLERRGPGEPLRWMLADPRQLRTTALVDDLWVRIVDVPAALQARGYDVAGDLVLDVTDAFWPEIGGRYRLVGGPDGATCEATSAEPDVELSAADLGAMYLGGVRLGTLARAGRVREHTPGGLARADAMFATRSAPWCGTPF
jgi:predicted acetyltransferase